jgi:hypothetical protein
MELFIPHTPLAIVIAAFLALIVGLKILKDAKEIRSSRQTHSTIMKFVKKKNVPRFGVVIELSRTADTIMPLLDHLYDQNYKSLEIVVMVKHTAGKYAQSKLMYYRRKNQYKNLKIIKHSKGMNMTTVIRRHISSEFVMQLHSNNTLSEGFFSRVAIEFLDNGASVIVPRRHIAPGKTVLGALCAAFSVWQHIFAVFSTPNFKESKPVLGMVYRRKSLLNDTGLNAVYIARIAVHDVAEVSWKTMFKKVAIITSKLLRTIRVRLAFVAGMIVIAGLSAYIWNEDTLLFAEFIVAIYSVAYGLSLLGLKDYSLSERINLLLFAPFSLVFGILVGLYSLLTIFYNWSGLRKFSLRGLLKYGRQRSLATPKL